MRPLSTCSMPEVQTDVLHAEEVLGHARTSLNVRHSHNSSAVRLSAKVHSDTLRNNSQILPQLLPTLFELGRAPPSSDVLQNILKDTATVVTNEVVGEVQVKRVRSHVRSDVLPVL